MPNYRVFKQSTGTARAESLAALSEMFRNRGHGAIDHNLMFFVEDDRDRFIINFNDKTNELRVVGVVICVGIDFETISSMARLSDHAARSIV